MKFFCSMVTAVAVLMIAAFPIFSNTSDNAALSLTGFIEALPDLVTIEIEQTEAEQQLTEEMDLTVSRENVSIGTLKALRQGTVTFSVYAESDNNFHLAHSEDTEALFPYTLNVVNGNDFSDGAVKGPLEVDIDEDEWSTVLGISHAAAELNQYPAGTYSDTITFTVQTDG